MPGLLDGLIDLGNPVADQPLNRGLLHWWLPLPNNSGGSRLFDLRGRAHATLTNGPSWAAGRDGFAALSFDGSNDYLATATTYNPVAGDFWLSLAVRPANASSNHTFFSSNFTGGVELWVGPFGGGGSYELKCYVSNNTVMLSGHNLTAGVWQRVGISRAGGTVTMWLNGRPDAGQTKVNNVTLANLEFARRLGGGVLYPGTIGDVRMYNRAPSTSEGWADYEQWREGWPDLLRRWRRRSFAAGTGAASYTLACDAGSYSLSGTAATLRVARRLTCGGGSYSLSGTAAAPEFGRRLAADSGSYSLSGQAASVEFGRRVAADAGSYSLSGQPAGVRAARDLDLAAGSYSLSGQDAGLDYSGSGAFTLACESGSYSLSGQAVALRVSRRVAPDAGVYTLAGQPAALPAARRLAAASGSYALSGADAGLTYAPASADLLDGLGAYYRLDGDLTDSSGNARHLSSAGTPTYAAAKLNTGMATGSGSRSPLGGLDGSAVSVSAWFRLTADGDLGGAQVAFGANLVFTTLFTEQGVSARVQESVGGLNGPTVVPAGQWVHAVLTWDGTTARLYVDGALAQSGAAGYSANFATAAFSVSADGSESTTPVDEVAVWDRALSAAEVALLYNGGDGFDPTAATPRRNAAAVAGQVSRGYRAGRVTRSAVWGY